MSEPIIYIKQGCPWCIDALAYFKEVGLKLDVVDVINDPSKMKDLISCSGQNKTPTLKNGDFVVADFDIDEFETALEENPKAKTNLEM